MKKIAIVATVLIGILVVAKMSGALVNYTLPTTSNEPTIPVGSHIFGSSLLQPKVGDFATFRPPLPESPSNDKHIYVKRLCGLAGDEIEMKNGIFYLNGENFDTSLSLQHSYVLDKQTFNSIKQKHPISDFDQAGEVYLVQIKDKVAEEFGILDKKIIQTTAENGAPVFEKFNENGQWTRDNFGPITVPNNMVFFMGDNRHYSYDSRYFGFVSIESVTGKVLGY